MIKFAGFGLVAAYVSHTIIFWLYPFLWGLVIAFKRWNIISPEKDFIGLSNFIGVLYDPLFWISFKNSLYFMVVYVPLSIVSALGVALLLSRIKFLQAFFAVGYLMSYISAGVAYSIVFSLLFSGDGLINTWLSKINITIPWFSDPDIAMASIALIVVWKFLGYYSLIFLAGLQAIPKSLYESASIDGASEWVQFFRITVPLLNPSFTIVLIFAVMLSFNIFTEPYMITGGGPLDSTQTFVMQIYHQTFTALHAGYGSSFAIIVAVISFAFVFVIRKTVERDVT
ncbi:MAG: sugar ABC transporter permease [Candidatus Marinimicrobia bacterium]|nr:sugar ABC transporter permease [Candidatus Neomarinimicrobiota bacterium]